MIDEGRRCGVQRTHGAVASISTVVRVTESSVPLVIERDLLDKFEGAGWRTRERNDTSQGQEGRRTLACSWRKGRTCLWYCACKKKFSSHLFLE